MPEAVIVATARSPIGRAFKGSLIEARADDTAGFIIDAALKKVPQLDRGEIVDVMMGAAQQVGEEGMNVGRTAAIFAVLPDTVAGTTVNRFCASTPRTIRMSYHAIKVGEGNAFVAAG